ncbi:peptidase [Streptomyces sp. NPDC001880]
MPSAPGPTPAPTPSGSTSPAGSTPPTDSAPGRALGTMPGRIAVPVPTTLPMTASGPASVPTFPTVSPASVPVTVAASLPVFTAPARPPSPSPPPGRTRHGLALGLAAASVVLGGTSVAPASAESSAAPVSSPDSTAADQQPSCGDPAAEDFPISTRIHGGPDTYAPGGGYGTWYLDLTNTTTESCPAIHPVLVLIDEDRKLTSDQIQLKFSEQDRPGTEHRVTWETTDHDEHIGVFGGDGDDSFGGFTVPAGRTVTVQVRMAFTSDTSPGRIIANAAIVQRQRVAGGTDGEPGKDDGAWVGESEEYPFAVVDGSDGGETAGTGETADIGELADTADIGELADTGEATDTGELVDTGEATDTGETAGTGEMADAGETSGTGETAGTETADAGETSGTSEMADAGETAGTGETSGTGEVGGTGDASREPRPVGPGRTPAQSDRPELAATGSVGVPAAGLTVAGLLIGGGAMVIKARRSRRAHP